MKEKNERSEGKKRKIKGGMRQGAYEGKLKKLGSKGMNEGK